MGGQMEEALLDLRNLQAKDTSHWEISKAFLKHQTTEIVSYKHPPEAMESRGQTHLCLWLSTPSYPKSFHVNPKRKLRNKGNDTLLQRRVPAFKRPELRKE